MITEIDYNGYIVNSFSLEEIQKTDGGYFVTSYPSQQMIGGEGDDDNFLTYQTVMELKAYNGPRNGDTADESKLAYILRVDFNINFINKAGNSKLDKNFFLENKDFLKKYTYLSSKLIVENLLEKTALDGIRLPYS